MRSAVVGHVEWVTFLSVAHVPVAGEIVHADEWWEEPGGGGAGAAVQLAKLSGACDFFTALGDDDLGRRAQAELERHGVTVHAALRPSPTRRAVTHVDARGERTITVAGQRLEPRGTDALPWRELREVDAVYFTAGDEQALRAARAAGAVVATSRILPFLKKAAVPLDGVVGSAEDASETYEVGALDPAPRVVVRTEGERGGTLALYDKERQRYEPVDPPGAIVDRYGAGDSFAAGLAYGLGAKMRPADAASFAARCGAHAVTGRGPYQGQLRLERA